jgi:hypothetical protein
VLLGEHHAAGAPLDDGCADRTFQRGDLLGDRRGCEQQRSGRLAEAPVGGHRAEDAQPLYVDQQFS